MTYFITSKYRKITNVLEIHFSDFDKRYNEIDLIKHCYNKDIFNNKFNLYDNKKYKGVCYKLSENEFIKLIYNFEDYKEKFWDDFNLTQIRYGCNHLTLKQKNYTYSK